MYSAIESQNIKLFDTDNNKTKLNVLKYADSRDFVMIDGKLTYIMPETIEVVGENAFNGSSVQRVVFSPNLKKICNDAFSACAIEEAVVPDSVVDIGKGAFIYCKKLKNVILPNGLKMLKGRTFAIVLVLKKLIFPHHYFISEKDVLKLVG